MSIPDLREDERPAAPPLPGVTEDQRRYGRQLAQIHAMYLGEMDAVRDLAARIGDGPEVAQALAETVEGMPMLQNLRRFGAVCGQSCQHLMMHHNIEEGHTFTILEQNGAPGLLAVIEKLRAEHKVIHALLEDLLDGARTVAEAPTAEGYERLNACLARLDGTLRSHFRYEEHELADAIGVHQAL